jgi:hypothetical protein
MRKWKWLGVILVVCALDTALGGRAFVVATNGNDANAGTLAQPWRTLAKANANLIAGDTVYIRAGTYTDPISPVNSGTAGNPLVYMNYQVEVCSLYVGATAINLIGKAYVFVQGVRVQMAQSVNNHVVTISGGGNNAIVNCRIYGGSTHNNPAWGDWPSFILSSSSYNRIIGNLLDRQDYDITSDAYRGDGIGAHGNSKYNIIEGNTVVNVSHFGIAVPYGVLGESFNIVRNNRIYNCHVGLGNTDDSYRCLYEGNQVWAPGEVNTYRGGVSCEFSPQKCIIRYNAFYDDSISTGSLQYNPGSNNSFVTNTAVSTPVDNRVYHNTFMGQTGTAVDRCSIYLQNDNPGVWDFGRNSFVNNIIAYPNKRPGSYPISWQDRGKTLATVTDRFRGNLLWKGAPGDVVANWGVSGGIDYKFTLAQLKAQMPSAWESTNFEASPLWLDSTSSMGNRRFSLSASSPCIDRGVALTRTRQTSTSTTAIYVTDASYFHYSWSGTSFDRGDSVYVDGVRAELQTIDYQNNILYTTTPVSVANDAGVYLLASYYTVGGYQNRLKGAAPDVGAFETGGTAPVAQAPPAPALLSPANAATGIALTAQIQWVASPTAASSQVQVSTSSSFSANVIDQGGITGTTYPLSSLGFTTTYFWRVRASNSAGTSPWSSVWQFSTVPDPGTATKNPENIVVNGDFESGVTNWSFFTTGTGSFATASPGFEGSLAGLVRITKAGDKMELTQAGITLEPATIYHLTFSARSSSAHDFTIALLKNTAPYTNYGLLARKFKLRKDYASFSTYLQTSNFAATIKDACLQIWFAGFAASGDEYTIDNVILVKSQAPSKPLSPRFVSPTAAASDLPVSLSVVWTAVPNADTYTLQLSTDSLFTIVAVDTVVSDTAVSVGPLQAGTRYYQRVRGTNISGDGTYSNVSSFFTVDQSKDGNHVATQPATIVLQQNYPNPFNPSTAVQYVLPEAARVVIKVYNTLGTEVATLEEGDRSAGTHTVIFDASRFASGAYFYTLRAAGFSQTKRMVLMR